MDFLDNAIEAIRQAQAAMRKAVNAQRKTFRNNVISDLNSYRTRLESDVKRLRNELESINDSIASRNPDAPISSLDYLGNENRYNNISNQISGYNDRIKRLNNMLKFDLDKYMRHLKEDWRNLNIDTIQRLAKLSTGDKHDIAIQSIYDPVIANKPMLLDEYSTVVTLPKGVTPQQYLEGMARDMDDFLGGEIKSRAEFDRWGGELAIGQVIDIDLLGNFNLNKVPIVVPPFIIPNPFGETFDGNPYNAPVVITDFDPNSHFSVQTIELDGIEHPLHGIREWGFETLPNGQVRFYTRGISVEDNLAAEALGKTGERDMWNSWVESLEDKVKRDGGTVIPNSQIVVQERGLTPNDYRAATK